MTFISYAQNFEDVRLWRAFSDVAAGRYLDVGTQDPVHDSVSLAFYERGWRGIHVEPTPTYAAAMRAARPDETVIEAAVTTAPGPMRFFEIPETGLSTGAVAIADRHKGDGWECREIVVPTVKLAGLFDFMGPDPIHWLKIDVEGMEADVIRSWGDHPARPAALVIEATAPNSTVQTHEEWYDLVLGRGYRDILFDGLSRYFVHETQAARGEALALSPNVFDGFKVTLSHFANREIAAERQRAVDDAVRQGAAEREAAMVEARRELEEQLADERAAHSAQQVKVLALVREAGQLEGQLATQTEHHAAQMREAEAARREVLTQLATTEDERSSAQREVADLRVRIKALSGQHALEMAKAQAAYDAAQSHIAAGKSEVNRLEVELTEHRAAREAEKLRLEQAAELAVQQITALQTELDQSLAAMARNERLLRMAGQLLIEPVDALDGWPRKLATMLVRLAGRKPDEVVARHASHVAAWRADTATGMQVIPDWTESPLAQNAADADLGFGYKEIQMLADEGPITTVPRLLAPHDAEFIDIAYQAVLGRAPDPQGRAYYLARLRTGTHKLEILRQLRHSAEGKTFVPGVAGLDRATRRFRLATTPIIGWVLRLFASHDGDSRQERQLRMLVNELGRLQGVQVSIYGATREIGAQLDQITSGQQALLTAGSTMAAARPEFSQTGGAELGNSAKSGDASYQGVSDHQAGIENLVADYFARR